MVSGATVIERPEAEEEQRRQDVRSGSRVRVEGGQRRPAAAISGPIPIASPGRSASAPNRPERKNIRTVTGVVAAPAWNAV